MRLQKCRKLCRDSMFKNFFKKWKVGHWTLNAMWCVLRGTVWIGWKSGQIHVEGWQVCWLWSRSRFTCLSLERRWNYHVAFNLMTQTHICVTQHFVHCVSPHQSWCRDDHLTALRFRTWLTFRYAFTRKRKLKKPVWQLVTR